MHEAQLILKKLEGMETAIGKIDRMEASLAELRNETAGLRNETAGLRNETAGLRADNADFRSSQDAVIDKLFEMDGAIAGIHEHMASKDDLRAAEGRLTNHVDGFTRRQQKFDIELVAMRNRMDRFAGQA